MHVECTNYFQKTYKMKQVKPDIGVMVRVFANGSGELGSIPGQVISKTQKNGI